MLAVLGLRTCRVRAFSKKNPQPSLVVALEAAGSEEPPKATPEQPARAQRWAELLARVFGLDMQKCADCGGPLKIVSVILEPHAIKAILIII